MSSLGSAASRARIEQRPKPRDRFYLGLTLFVLLFNIAAFVPPIADPSTRTVPLPLSRADFAHALASVAWLLVFLMQTALIVTGRPAAHRRLGVIGVLLSAALIITTWFMLVEGARRGFDLSGDLVPRGTSLKPSEYFATANVLLPFGLLVGIAVWFRRRPAVHKRLMMLAMLGTTGAPLAHLIGHWPALRSHL